MFTVRPVEDIGREIGFEDPAYFSRFFRKRIGEAPAAHDTPVRDLHEIWNIG